MALALAVINLGEFVEGVDILRTALTQIRNLPDETILAGTAMGFLSLGYADQEDPSFLGQAEEMAAACIKSVADLQPARQMDGLVGQRPLEPLVIFDAVAEHGMRVSEPAAN